MKMAEINVTPPERPKAKQWHQAKRIFMKPFLWDWLLIIIYNKIKEE